MFSSSMGHPRVVCIRVMDPLLEVSSMGITTTIITIDMDREVEAEAVDLMMVVIKHTKGWDDCKLRL